MPKEKKFIPCLRDKKPPITKLWFNAGTGGMKVVLSRLAVGAGKTLTAPPNRAPHHRAGASWLPPRRMPCWRGGRVWSWRGGLEVKGMDVAVTVPGSADVFRDVQRVLQLP